MEQKKVPWTFRFVKWCIRVCYGKVAVFGTEHLPQEPCIVVGNHSQLHGPIACELFFPTPRYTWCAGDMLRTRDVPAYAFRDFWSFKPKYTHPFYKLLSYLVAPLGAFLCSNANTIGVYRDARGASTFKKTIRVMEDGYSVVIFPEHNVRHDHILYDFEEQFIDVAKLYYKRTGKAPCFVPMYLAPNLRQMHFAAPNTFDPAAPIEEERRRIKQYLMETIRETAEALPRHTVVPYRNIPRKEYPCNKPDEVK